jgi:hypothetical protein
MRMTKKLLLFENEFQHAFLHENCAGCAIRNLHLALLVVVVAIRKLQLAVRKKASKKPSVKILMKLTPSIFVFSTWSYI